MRNYVATLSGFAILGFIVFIVCGTMVRFAQLQASGGYWPGTEPKIEIPEVKVETPTPDTACFYDALVMPSANGITTNIVVIENGEATVLQNVGGEAIIVNESETMLQVQQKAWKGAGAIFVDKSNTCP